MAFAPEPPGEASDSARAIGCDRTVTRLPRQLAGSSMEKGLEGPRMGYTTS